MIHRRRLLRGCCATDLEVTSTTSRALPLAGTLSSPHTTPPPPPTLKPLQVAQQLHHGGHAAGQRSQMLQASLVEQLDEARAAAGEAATARATAEAAAAAAQAELEAAHQQQAALGKAAAAAKKANAEAAQRVQRLLTEVRTGRRGAREAEEQLRGMEREAAPPEAAAMRLLGLRAAAKV